MEINALELLFIDALRDETKRGEILALLFGDETLNG